ncbi:FRG domain-containing protein [Shewanella sp. KX20019]|uniref:FRG domain-containing protein n=1 Tax=Shewanella sp. KX20019 TaxID=2803864 RepID=UPI001926E436|nr:FRG domain-containing protein [Shewanella sp. KX20019]QQX78541.1 FRG domain-containing protein [Shewanella sp. KX20019]
MDIEEVDAKFITKECFDVQTFLSYLSPLLNEDIDFRSFIFRGHGKSSYQLAPSALRRDDYSVDKLCAMSAKILHDREEIKFEHNQVNAEINALRQFFRISNRNGLHTPSTGLWFKNDMHLTSNQFSREDRVNDESWMSKDLLELAALAQHYGVPTRLLDWTHDSMIATFFACTSDIKNTEEDLCVWMMNANWISMLKKSKKIESIMFFTPEYKDNSNVTAQKGLFTFTPSIFKRNRFSLEELCLPQERRDIILGTSNLADTRSLNEIIHSELVNSDPANLGDAPLFIKVTLPASLRLDLYNKLLLLGYDFPRVYPGYLGVARHLDFLKHIPEKERIKYTL